MNIYQFLTVQSEQRRTSGAITNIGWPHSYQSGFAKCYSVHSHLFGRCSRGSQGVKGEGNPQNDLFPILMGVTNFQNSTQGLLMYQFPKERNVMEFQSLELANWRFCAQPSFQRVVLPRRCDGLGEEPRTICSW